MAYYDMTKGERQNFYNKMADEISANVFAHNDEHIINYFSDHDTYIRKNAYLILSRLYISDTGTREDIVKLLDRLSEDSYDKIRQTTIYTAGEIGRSYFDPIRHLLTKGLFDHHHSVRNAVIGALKRIGEKNPLGMISLAHEFLLHEDPEVRRQIVHGLELRGRDHPEEVLPLLKRLQYEDSRRVYDMIIHVLGQISYKNGCLAIGLNEMKTWDNQNLVNEALEEIVEVHSRYHKFSAENVDESITMIKEVFDRDMK